MVVNPIQYVYNHLPRDTNEKALYSGFASFVMGTLLTSNSQRGLVLGTIAATASFVHALTTPLFRKLLNREDVTWQENLGRTVITLALTNYLINSCTAMKVNLLSGILGSVLLHMFVNGTENQSLRNSAYYIFF